MAKQDSEEYKRKHGNDGTAPRIPGYVGKHRRVGEERTVIERQGSFRIDGKSKDK